jgi:hypothetical protein
MLEVLEDFVDWSKMEVNGKKYVTASYLNDMNRHKYIRGREDELLKVKELPVQCHHASWRDGGLSYPSLVDRRRVLIIRSFTQMMTSKDEKVKRRCAGSRKAKDNIESLKKIEMHNFSTGRKKKEEERGTGSIIARTRNTCYKMEVSLKMNDDEMTITSGESELKIKTATGIGCFMTEKLIRVKKFEKLIQHPVHGASHTTLRSNVSSNAC